MRDDQKTKAELLRELDALRRQVTELKQIEHKKTGKELGDSEQVIKTILNNAADGIALTDVDNKKFYLANKVFCKLLGYNLQEIKNLEVSSIHPEKDLPYVLAQFELQAKQELTVAKNIPIRKKDGSVIYTDVNSFPINLAGKTYLMGIFRDITEHREVEENIERLARFPLENPYPVLRISRDGTILYHNKGAEPLLEIWKYREGKPLPGRWHECVLNALDSGVISCETCNEIKHNDQIFSLTFTPVVDSHYVNVYGFDITERKKAENKLRESETQVRSLIQTAPNIILHLSPDHRILEFNPEAEQFFGRKRDDVLGQNYLELFVPEQYRDEIAANIEKVLAGEPTRNHENLLIAHDGSEHLFMWNVNRLLNSQNQPSGIIAIGQDITERKRWEETLRESEEKYRLAMETTNDALWDWNIVTNEVYRNIRHTTMLGYEPHELSASQDEWEKLIHPDDKQLVLEVVDEHLAGKRDSIEVEYRLRTKSGDYIWVLGRGKVVTCSDDGSPVRMIGTNIDITARKRAEEALVESEERYRTYINHAPDGVFVVDANGKYIEVNEAACRMAGYSSEELLNMSISELLAPTTIEVGLNGFKQLKCKGKFSNVSLLRHRDGTEFYVALDAVKLSDNRFMAYCKDITKRKKAEEEIEKFKKMADLAPHGCVISDLDGNLTYINDSFARMHGYTSAELIGKNFEIFHTDAQMKRLSELKKQLIETGQEIHGEEIWHVHRDGTEFPTLMSDWVMRDDHGNPSLMCATAIDITELKLMEQHERKHREEIAHFARLSTIGEMSSALAHELNQPLCAIVTHAEGAVRMMKSGDWDSNELLEAMEEAGTQAERAGKIIHRIANLVRKKEPHRSSVNIGEIIGETINLIEYEAQLKGITIQWVEPSEKPQMLKVDRIQIQQVLVNLLHNSFEAMKNVDQSKRQIIIEVSTDENDMVQVVVSDAGCGLSAESTDRIFEPFFTTTSQGLGIGLSISRSIIKAHGGRIWAESNPAGGATFRFTLPLKRGTL